MSADFCNSWKNGSSVKIKFHSFAIASVPQILNCFTTICLQIENLAEIKCARDSEYNYMGY